MEDNFDQLKTLKELLESGAISKSEYDTMKAEFLRESMAKDGVKSAQKPSAFSTFISKHKWKFVATVILIISGLFFINFLSPDPLEEGKKLAVSYCDCQKKKNEAYIERMSEFIQSFESEGYKFAKDVNNDVTKMNNEYNLSTLTPDISSCFKSFELKNTAAVQKWKSNTTDGKVFWEAYQAAIISNTELVTQEEEISLLRDRIQSKTASMIFENPEEYENRKSEISAFLRNYYENLESSYFDAYNYFAYSVEQFLTSKNITPTEINMIQKKESDYVDKETKLIDETIELVGVENDRQSWKFSTEFKAYRSSMEKFQVCNIWYEIVLNSSGKIVVLKELLTENKRLFSPSEYNEIFNGGSSYESEESGW